MGKKRQNEEKLKGRKEERAIRRRE